MKTITKTVSAVAVLTTAISTTLAALPDPGMEIEKGRTALVVTDPQNDFLSPKGVTWGVVGKSVEANNTVANIDTLFKTAKAQDIPVFVLPHYYYPHDHGWKFEGALEVLMHKLGMFDRKDPLTVEGFAGSGADWLERYKPYINDGHTTVTSPHKVYGPETNDLVLTREIVAARQGTRLRGDRCLLRPGTDAGDDRTLRSAHGTADLHRPCAHRRL